jgi:hypothetical protein
MIKKLVLISLMFLLVKIVMACNTQKIIQNSQKSNEDVKTPIHIKANLIYPVLNKKKSTYLDTILSSSVFKNNDVTVRFKKEDSTYVGYFEGITNEDEGAIVYHNSRFINIQILDSNSFKCIWEGHDIYFEDKITSRGFFGDRNYIGRLIGKNKIEIYESERKILRHTFLLDLVE